MSFKKKIKGGIKFILNNIPARKFDVRVVNLAPNELLKGRVALITGGTSGIGFHMAAAFLRSGAAVVITGRSKERLQRACAELDSGNVYGGRLFSLAMDNACVDQFQERFHSALEMVKAHGYPHIDILVNNAGVLGASMPDAVAEEFDKVMATNLKGAFFLSQLFGKYMKENKITGNILNVGSSSSLRPAVSAYTLSKWGIRGLTLGLAKALAPYGITVNGIAPGPTMTPMLLQDYGLSTPPPQFVKKSYRPLCLSGRDRQYGSGAGERYGQDHCGRHGIYDGRRGCHNLRRRRVHFLNPAERYVDVPVEAGHMIHV